MSVEFFVSIPPTVNNYYVKTRNGVFISKAGKAFREKAAEDIIQQVGGVHLTGHFHVEIIMFFNDRRRRDLDNYLKALLDAITHSSLWSDDCLVDQLVIMRGRTDSPKRESYVRVEIGPAGPILSESFTKGI